MSKHQSTGKKPEVVYAYLEADELKNIPDNTQIQFRRIFIPLTEEEKKALINVQDALRPTWSTRKNVPKLINLNMLKTCKAPTKSIIAPVIDISDKMGEDANTRKEILEHYTVVRQKSEFFGLYNSSTFGSDLDQYQEMMDLIKQGKSGITPKFLENATRIYSRLQEAAIEKMRAEAIHRKNVCN